MLIISLFEKMPGEKHFLKSLMGINSVFLTNQELLTCICRELEEDIWGHLWVGTLSSRPWGIGNSGTAAKGLGGFGRRECRRLMEFFFHETHFFANVRAEHEKEGRGPYGAVLLSSSPSSQTSALRAPLQTWTSDIVQECFCSCGWVALWTLTASSLQPIGRHTFLVLGTFISSAIFTNVLFIWYSARALLLQNSLSPSIK